MNSKISYISTFFPQWLQYLAYFNPLTYGVDGLRASLIGTSRFPILLDFAIPLATSAVMVFAAAYLFQKTEVD